MVRKIVMNRPGRHVPSRDALAPEEHVLCIEGARQSTLGQRVATDPPPIQGAPCLLDPLPIAVVCVRYSSCASQVTFPMVVRVGVPHTIVFQVSRRIIGHTGETIVVRQHHKIQRGRATLCRGNFMQVPPGVIAGDILAPRHVAKQLPPAVSTRRTLCRRACDPIY